MTIKPIKTEEDYQQALQRLEKIFDAKKNSAEGDELEILSILIDKYENEHFQISYPDPIEAIQFRMEQLGYNEADLEEVAGLKTGGSEILSKKTKLSLEIIRQLHESLKIPADVLIQAY